MNTQSETLKRELLAAAEEAIEATLAWDAGHPAHSFAEIEALVLQVRRRMGQRMARILCEHQAAEYPVPGPCCPQCGREMHYKGEYPRQVGSLVGEVRFERSYYHCDPCQGGIFPPG